MELKKNPNSDLRKWSGTFFNLGLAIGIASTLVAFEWKAYSSSPLLEINGTSDSWHDVIPPISIQDPPPPPPPPTPIEVNIKPDDIEIDDVIDVIDINKPENTEIPTVIIDTPPIIEKADEIKDYVDVQASFQGGMDAWYTYLNKNLKYPSQARRMGIEGMVIVRFVVNTDGTIQDVELLRNLGGGTDEVALEVVKNSPNWTPGKIGGRSVRSRMTLPIRFRLN